jgi:hypothetical protein
MDILPILSTLRRHKLTSWLLILEIALTCAIVCNAVFLIGQRLQRMDMPSGVVEHELLQIQVADAVVPPNPYARISEDVAALRQVPGVISVASTNEVPFGNSSSNGNLRLDPISRSARSTQPRISAKTLPKTMGARLIAGRDLQPDDFMNVDVVLKALGTGDSKSIPSVTLINDRAMAGILAGSDRGAADRHCAGYRRAGQLLGGATSPHHRRTSALLAPRAMTSCIISRPRIFCSPPSASHSAWRWRIAINLFLMAHYELPRLPGIYFPVGALSLWLIGQLAVLGPALRAAAVPPVVATRSV